MKRIAALSLLALVIAFASAPCQAQFLKKLEQQFMNNGQGQQQGQQQGQGMPGQPQLVGNVSLPPGQYMMTNTATGQGFYVSVQNGQMYMTQGTPQGMGGGLGQGGGGLGGMLQGAGGQGGGGLGGLLQGAGGQGGGGGLGGMLQGAGGQGGYMGGQQQQQGGLGGLGNFLKNELSPGQQQQAPGSSF